MVAKCPRTPASISVMSVSRIDDSPAGVRVLKVRKDSAKRETTLVAAKAETIITVIREEDLLAKTAVTAIKIKVRVRMLNNPQAFALRNVPVDLSVRAEAVAAVVTRKQRTPLENTGNGLLF